MENTVTQVAQQGVAETAETAYFTTQTGFRITSVFDQIERAQGGAVTTWLAEGILVRGGSTMLYAPPAAGKSLVALDLALAATEGRPWLSHYPISAAGGAGESAPVRTLYIDEDGNNDNELNQRLLSFHAQSENPNLHFALHNGFKITDEAARRAMIVWCEDSGIELVVMDSMTRLHNMAEGSADEMKQVSAAIKDFTMAGLTVVILHHAAKRGKIARGSSEIESGFDAIYRLERVDDFTFKMSNQKARSVAEGKGIWPGCLITVGKDEAGRLALDGGTVLYSDEDGESAPPIDKAAQKREKMREGVLSLLSENDELTESALAEKLGNSGRDKDEFKLVLAELALEELIEHEKRGKGNWYWLVDDEEDGDAEGEASVEP